MIIGKIINSFANIAQPMPGMKPVEGAGMSNYQGNIKTPSGQKVDPESARKIATAYRCANILSDDVGKLPLQTFSSRRFGQVERVMPNGATKNISYRLEVSPNELGWQTPFLFKKMAIQWLLFHGNAYFWHPINETRQMFLLNADSTFPELDESGALWYSTTFKSGKKMDIPAVEITHLMINPHPHGYIGRSILEYARESMGRQLGAFQTQDVYWNRGLNPAGIAWVPGEPTKETREKIRNVYAESFGGSGKAGGLLVMGQDEFVKFESISMKPKDMQFLEGVAATDVDIANFFGVPEYKLNHGKQSYESNEQQDLDYLKTTLDAYLVPIEQAGQLKWLSIPEQMYMYFRFNRDAILRTNAQKRGETLNAAISFGRLSPNEARQIEDQPAYDGGDDRYIGANLIPIGKAGETDAPAPGAKNNKLENQIISAAPMGPGAPAPSFNFNITNQMPAAPGPIGGNVIIDTTGRAVETENQRVVDAINAVESKLGDPNKIADAIDSMADQLAGALARQADAIQNSADAEPQIIFAPVIQPSEVVLQPIPAPITNIENKIELPASNKKMIIRKQGDIYTGETQTVLQPDQD